MTAFQAEVLTTFFDLPESNGYVLAGGAGLLAVGLTDRPTDDLDLFGSDLAEGVEGAADALERACRDRGWEARRVHDHPTFRRVAITAGDTGIIVDLAIDTPPLGAIHLSPVGPTFAPVELAGRKLLALFDRAAARDFADLFRLTEVFAIEDLIAVATELDGGFDLDVLRSMLSSIDRFTDSELAATGADPTDLRRFAGELGRRTGGQ